MPSIFTLEGPRAIPNGKSAGMTPDMFDPTQLAIGTRVEMEHTTDRQVAQRIAMDHLVEDPLYYQKLRTIHLDGAILTRSSLRWLAIGGGVVAVALAGRWTYQNRRYLKRMVRKMARG